MSCSSEDIGAEQLPIKRLLSNLIVSLQNEWISECQELCQTLQSPYLNSLLNVADCVARRFYDLDNLDYILSAYACELGVDKSKVIRAKKRKVPNQKIVNVIKSHEPLGVTVRFEEKTGHIVLTRILVGSAAYRSGLVNVGDRILEVNGITLRGRSHLDVINILQKECLKTTISFRLMICKKLNNEQTVKSVVVKAHFDYEPCLDRQLPCDQIGLAFTRGCILTVLNQEDPNWWQACKETETSSKSRMELFQIAGLIPSQCLQERRTVAKRDLRSKMDRYRYIHILGGLLPTPFRKSRWSAQKIKRIMYDLSDCINYDREEIWTYEPVAKYFPKPHYFRPIILIGPTGVGCSLLIRLLINYKPNRYREPLAHTTRYQRFAESDGIDYYFVSEQWMEKEIKRGNFVCYSQHRGNYYGLHKSTVGQIIDGGYVCIFKMDARFLRLVHTAEFKPYVIFVRPPYDLTRLVESRLKYSLPNGKRKSRSRLEYEMHLMIYEAHKLEFLFGHKFDATIVNDDIRQTFNALHQILVSVENEPKWVPLSWVNKSSSLY